MKIQFNLIALSIIFLFHYQLNGQNPSISIGQDKTICNGDKLILKATIKNASTNGKYIWETNKGNAYGTNAEFQIEPLIKDFTNSFDVKCTYFFNDDKGNTKKIETSIEVQLNELPDIGATISSFRRDESIFLEVNPVNPDYNYKWISPNNAEYEGPVGVFKDVKLTDFGEYSLLITNKNTYCSASFKHEVELNEDEESGNVFGSNNENDIPDLLYREIKRDAPVYECEITGTNKHSEYKIAYPGYQFTIVGEIENDYIIRFWHEKIDDIKTKDNSDHTTNQDTYTRDLKNGYKIILFSKNQKTNGQVTVVGKLIDSNGNPATSLDIMEKGTTNVIATDIDGKFNLNVSSNKAELEFKNEGYSLGILTSLEKKSFQLDNEDVDEYNSLYVVKSTNKKSGVYDYRYFRIRKSEVDSRTVAFAPTKGIKFTAGTVLVPVKLRQSNDLTDKGFEFSKDIALGPYVGFQKRLSIYRPYYLNLGVTFGVSSVRLTSGNSNSELTQSVQDLAALTMAFGAVFEFDKVQIGIFAGVDKINNNSNQGEQKGYDWAYHNKVWWSIGFGYSIVSRPKSSDRQNESGLVQAH